MSLNTARENCLKVFYYPYVDLGDEAYNAEIIRYCNAGARAVLIGYCMIGLMTLIAIGMAYVTIVVKRLVSKQDRLLPYIFGFMTASVSVYVLYYIQAVLVEFRLDWFLSGHRSLRCAPTYLSRTASLFLIIGAILNLAKWL
jgi:hypothetical protein